MRTIIKHRGHEIEVIAIVKFATDTATVYDYWVSELITTNRPWKKNKKLFQGDTVMWDFDADFETEIIKRLDEYFDDVATKNAFDKSVEKFFSKTLDKINKI